MGSVITKAANGVGGLLGNAITAPFKSIFGESCEDVCSGPWDVICFIEHICVSNLLKLLMIFVLCYITLLFFYILFKVGICRCIGRSLCRMCWAACETYWYALEDITCFLWHKLNNTKRINRRRRRRRRRHRHLRDIEQGYSSSSGDETDFSSDYHHLNVITKHNSVKRRRRDSLRNSFYPSSRIGASRRHLKLKSRQMSIRVKGGSRRLRIGSSREFQLQRGRNVRRGDKISKRRRIR